MAAAAESISGLRDQWHQLILGKTVESVTGLKPLSDIASEVALPGDTLFTTTKLLVEGLGIVIGLMAHQPLLVNACLKSFTHDAAVKLVSEGIGDFFADIFDPADTREHKPNNAEARGDLKPQEEVPTGAPSFGARNAPLQDGPQPDRNQVLPARSIRTPGV